MRCAWCEKPLPWRGKLAVMRNPYRFIHCGRPECEESKARANRQMADFLWRSGQNMARAEWNAAERRRAAGGDPQQ